jgi:hypothetical protein
MPYTTAQRILDLTAQLDQERRRDPCGGAAMFIRTQLDAIQRAATTQEIQS